nr:hypothetical protein GCM10020092_073790 [Actinoplanes digitatis]
MAITASRSADDSPLPHSQAASKEPRYPSKKSWIRSVAGRGNASGWPGVAAPGPRAPVETWKNACSMRTNAATRSSKVPGPTAAGSQPGWAVKTVTQFAYVISGGFGA